MTKKMKKHWNLFTSILVSLLIILAVLLVGARVFGLQVYTVLSGSMEPTYKTGSVIYVKPVKASQVEVGDPISFVLNEELTVVTHRVIDIDTDKKQFHTKGDANSSADGGSVHFENLIGKPILSIPYLGYFVTYIRKPPGLYLAIAGAAILMLLVFLPDLFAEKKVKERKKTIEDPT